MPMDRLHPGESNWAPAPVRPRGPPASVTPRCNDRYMSVISLLAVLIGIAIGAVLGFLFARSREASAATGLAARASAAEERGAPPASGPPWSRASSPAVPVAVGAGARRQHQAVPGDAEGRLDAANAKALASWRPAAPRWRTWSGR